MGQAAFTVFRCGLARDTPQDVLSRGYALSPDAEIGCYIRDAHGRLDPMSVKSKTNFREVPGNVPDQVQ